MFNLYQNLNKRDESDWHRDTDVTGHDRFYQARNRRKRRGVLNRRTQSAIELDTAALTSARGVLRRGKSVSVDDDDSDDEEKGIQLVAKIDYLAKILFNRVSMTRACRDQNETRRRQRSRWQARNNCFFRPFCILWDRCLKCFGINRTENEQPHWNALFHDGEVDFRTGRYRYETLGRGRRSGGDELDEIIELTRRTNSLGVLEYLTVQNGRFHLIESVSSIGSRIEKHWFLVNDVELDAERFMTVTPITDNCILPMNEEMQRNLKNIFSAIQFPYILPILDFHLVQYQNKYYSTVILPIAQGSLKDLIYNSGNKPWDTDYVKKYGIRGTGLSIRQIKVIGRQVIEALRYLHDRGFPIVTNLHTGNVIIQNGAARLSGVENTLLGFTNRNYRYVNGQLKHPNEIEAICFAHMLYEMAAGYELQCAKPNLSHYNDLATYPEITRIMHFVFDRAENQILGMSDIANLTFFQGMDLRELHGGGSNVLFRESLEPSAVQILETVKNHNEAITVGERVTSLDTAEIISSEIPEAEYEDSLLVEIYNELSNTTI